jgi:hypothetical protein
MGSEFTQHLVGHRRSHLKTQTVEEGTIENVLKEWLRVLWTDLKWLLTAVL